MLSYFWVHNLLIDNGIFLNFFVLTNIQKKQVLCIETAAIKMWIFVLKMDLCRHMEYP